MSYKIKIPVFITVPLAEPVNNYESMIKQLQSRIDGYGNINLEDKCVISYRKKSLKKTIKHLHYDIYTFSGVQAVMLRIEEFKTGLLDLYVEHDEALNLDANDKLGSNYNYALFYPLINFDRTGKPSNRWAIFIYDDPGKDDTDVINTIKSVAIKIFDLKIKQIQREGAKENILRQGIIEQIKITYATKQNINNEDIEFKDYLVSLKEQDNRVEVYEGLPSKDALTLIHNRNTRGFNIKKIFVKLNNHQKYKYVYESNEQKDLILTALLEDNCYEISVDENDLLHLYDPINVQSYLSSVINQFIANE